MLFKFFVFISYGEYVVDDRCDMLIRRSIVNDGGDVE